MEEVYYILDKRLPPLGENQCIPTLFLGPIIPKVSNNVNAAGLCDILSLLAGAVKSTSHRTAAYLFTMDSGFG